MINCFVIKIVSRFSAVQQAKQKEENRFDVLKLILLLLPDYQIAVYSHLI